MASAMREKKKGKKNLFTTTCTEQDIYMLSRTFITDISELLPITVQRAITYYCTVQKVPWWLLFLRLQGF